MFEWKARFVSSGFALAIIACGALGAYIIQDSMWAVPLAVLGLVVGLQVEVYVAKWLASLRDKE